MFKKIKKFFKKKEVKNFGSKAFKLVSDFKNNLKEDFVEIKETVSEKASVIKETVSEKTEKVMDKAEGIKETVSEKIDSIKDRKILYDDFSKVEIRVGEILSVEKIKNSDKLLLLKVDLGEEENRQIVSGVANYYEDPKEFLEGKQAMFVSNLEPRKIFGYESNGMILALNDDEGFSILSPEIKIKNGTRAS